MYVRAQESEKKEGNEEKGSEKAKEGKRRRRRSLASKEITIFAYVNYRPTGMND